MKIYHVEINPITVKFNFLFEIDISLKIVFHLRF